MLHGHLITERPILFQGEMVKAILDDIKTQTRRTKGLDLINKSPGSWTRDGNPRTSTNRFYDSSKEVNPNPIAIKYGFDIKACNRTNKVHTTYLPCPFGKPGDLLWVREKHRISDGMTTKFYQYFADRDDWMDSKINKWKPSIHMPKAASRIWVMIEDIRAERLHDISEEDASDEGVEFIESDNFFERGFRNYLRDPDDPNYDRAVRSFETLWILINGQDSFYQNPWVWVIKYRVLSKTGRPSEDIILKNYLEVTGKEVVNV